MAVSLPEILTEHARSLKAGMHTSIPAKVSLYDPVTNLVTCRPVVKEPFFLADGDREYEEYPDLVMQVQWPRFGGKVIRGLLEQGDHVLVHFSEASLAEWRASGQTSEPQDARRFSVGYGFATPGAEPDSNLMSLADAVEIAAGALIIGEDGGDQILIGGTVPGIRCGKLAISPVALAVPTDAGLAGVNAALVAMTAAITTMVSTFNAHTHVCSAPASPSAVPVGQMVNPPAAPAVPGTTASLLTKSL